MTTRRSFVKDAALLSAATLVAAPVTATAASLAVNGTTSAGTTSAGAELQPASFAAALAAVKPPAGSPQNVARDEAYWKRVAAQYRVNTSITNMEAGYFGMMSVPVMNAHMKHIERANRDSSYYVRREYPADMQKVRVRVAEFVGAKPTEIALTRGATEALQCLIGQYNKVGAGDTVMYADLDYQAMQYAMNALAQRTGATVATLDIPEPASRENILDAYTKALDANPRTKLLLLTHCNNKTGLLHPVKDIVALARPRGVDVVVDAAHSFGQLELTLADLDADFVGLNLHKWIGAPVGAGAMYIRADKLASINRAHGDETPLASIDGRIHTGTTNFAIVMTIPDALDFQAAIGVPYKSARLRYLRDRWVSAVRNTRGIDILTPDAPRLVGALTSFRMHGKLDRASNQANAKTLLDEFGIFTTWRNGLAKGDCVRVTPALYNSAADADTLAAALNTMAARA